MDTALKVSPFFTDNHFEGTVTASNEAYGFESRGTRYVCKHCFQPVDLVSVDSYFIRPYFRHERNNAAAQRCELFNSSEGSSSTFNSIPITTFIRPDPKNLGQFIVEYDRTSYERARCESTETYLRHALTHHDIQTTSPADPSRVVASYVSLGWNESRPSIASQRNKQRSRTPSAKHAHALIFTRDPATSLGRRIEQGDSVQFGQALTIVSARNLEPSLKWAFEDVSKAGTVRKANGQSDRTLHVFFVTVPQETKFTHEVKNFLKIYGIKISQINERPSIVWPPCLIASGHTKSTFDSERRLIIAPRESENGNALRIYTRAKKETVYLQSSLSDSPFGFAIIQIDPNGESFVTTKREVPYMTSIIYRNTTHNTHWKLPTAPSGVSLEEESESTIQIRLGEKALIRISNKTGVREIEIQEKASSKQKISSSIASHIDVLPRLKASNGRRRSWTYSFDQRSQ